MNSKCHENSLPELSIVDPHIHLFDLSQGDYHWLKSENPPFWPDKAQINKNFSEQSLQLKAPLLLKGFVHIEAGFDNEQPWREIHWLEQTCTLPFRSIAYIDILASPINFSLVLSRLTQFSSLVGVRYIFDDNFVDDFISSNKGINLSEILATNLQQLVDANLLFELHISFDDTKLVALFSQLLPQLPKLKVIINHCGFPSIKEEDHKNHWLIALKSFSQQSNIAIKCSGLEMSSREYSNEWQLTIITACLRYFGESRVMLASNFPLTLFKESYNDYWQRTVNVLITLLAKSDHKESNKIVEKLCKLNSQMWYQLTI